MFRSVLRRIGLAAGAVLAVFAAIPADAVYDPPPLADRLTPELVQRIFPGAETLGPAEGVPPSIAVFQGDEVVGYIFSTIDVAIVPGYSGVPFDVIAGVDLNGLVPGAEVIYHHEAFIERDPIRQRLLAEYLLALSGTEQTTPRDEVLPPDFVRGATVSARTMRLAVWSSARQIRVARSGLPPVTEPTIDYWSFSNMTADELIADGAISHLAVTNAEVSALLDAEVGLGARPEAPIGSDPEAFYLDVFVGFPSPPIIGRNLMGAIRHDEIYGQGQPLGVLYASWGSFSPRGIKYQNESSGYLIERLQVVQGEETFYFHKDDLVRATIPYNEVPSAREAGILFLPDDSGFDPLRPWRMEFNIIGIDADYEPFSVTIPIDVEPSSLYVLTPQPEPPPAWLEAWVEARGDLIVLAVALTVLTLLMAFQHQLTKRRRLYTWTRNGFLLFTLVWLGWIAGGQLSTIHLINYARGPFNGYDLAAYLAEPLIVVIAVYTLLALLVLGRGVFCGWLCPFGALQELLAKVARFFRLPQWNPSAQVQSYAWLGKYIAFGGLVIVAAGWPEAEPLAAEVEPFKTAITSMFSRPLPYVAYAVLLLGIGLFTERAYCRFLCPLGGGLAILDRLHLVNLLKRRPQCGTSCHLCERSCPVKAIKPTGEIVMAECFQCLDCQVEYHDDHRCPPLAKERKLRQKAGPGGPTIGQPIPAFARAAGPALGADR